MKNDGQCWVWIPTDISMTTLKQSGVDRINKVHTTLGLPLVTLTTRNPYKGFLTDIADTKADAERNIEVWDDVPMSAWGPISNMEYLLQDNMYKLIVMAGGDIEGLQCFIVIDDVKAECPLSTTTPKETWETWGTFVSGDNISHAPVKYGDKWYRTTCVGQSGSVLNVSKVINLTLISREDYHKIVSDNTPSLP